MINPKTNSPVRRYGLCLGITAVGLLIIAALAFPIWRQATRDVPRSPTYHLAQIRGALLLYEDEYGTLPNRSLAQLWSILPAKAFVHPTTGTPVPGSAEELEVGLCDYIYRPPPPDTRMFSDRVPAFPLVIGRYRDHGRVPVLTLGGDFPYVTAEELAAIRAKFEDMERADAVPVLPKDSNGNEDDGSEVLRDHE